MGKPLRVALYLIGAVGLLLGAFYLYGAFSAYDPQRFLFTGDYHFDADPALLLGMRGQLLEMYGTEPAPLMLPLALLGRLLFLIPLDLAGIIDGGSEDHARDMRYLAGALGILVLTTPIALLLARTLTRESWAQASAAMRRLGPAIAGLGLLAALLFNPLTRWAITWGHPEEILLAVLCLAALLAPASRRRGWLWAALALAAAGAVKQPGYLLFPVVLLAVAPAERKRFVVAFAGASALFVIPFLAPHLSSALFNATSSATVGFVDGETAHHYNLFHALGADGQLGWMGRPLLALFAVGAPWLCARRRGWKLGVGEALAVGAAVMLARCLLDPFTIVYYQLPAIAILFGGELWAWRVGQHPLQMLAGRLRFVRALPPLPYISVLASILLAAATSIGMLTSEIGALIPNGSGVIYTLIVCPMVIWLLWIGSGHRIRFRADVSLGLGLLATVALLAGLIGYVVDNQNRLDAGQEHQPPPEYVRMPTDELARKLNPLKVYGLERGSWPLHYSTYRLSKESSATEPTTLLEYGDPNDYGGGITIYTYRPGKFRNFKRQLRICKSAPSTCESKKVVHNRMGTMLMSATGGKSWEAMIFNGRQMVYVIIIDADRYDPAQVLAELEPLPGRAGSPGHQGRTSGE